MAKAALIPLICTFLLGRFAASEPVRALDTDFPDRCLIQTSDGYYAFATSGNEVNVQVATSPDFLHVGAFVWPGRPPRPVPILGRFLFPRRFHQALYRAATSTSITGPYIPEANPLACPLDQGGAIDPNGYNDGGTYHVLYKVEGSNLDGDGTIHPTPIMLQGLELEGVTLNGDPIQLLDRDSADRPLIEAPSLMNVDGTYYLTFSSNMYDTTLYDTSYATASSIFGPFTKAQAPYAPLLVTGDPSNVGALSGPGGTDLSIDDSKIVFHAFENGQNIDNRRALYTCYISASGGVISLV